MAISTVPYKVTHFRGFERGRKGQSIVQESKDNIKCATKDDSMGLREINGGFVLLDERNSSIDGLDGVQDI